MTAESDPYGPRVVEDALGSYVESFVPGSVDEDRIGEVRSGAVWFRVLDERWNEDYTERMILKVGDIRLAIPGESRPV